MKRGFTLIEMLVAIGIIAVLIAAISGSYAGITKAAQRTRCLELVSNTATALTALYQETGVWPRALRQNGGGTDGELDEETALPLAGYMSLAVSSDKTRLIGYDRFGIVSPWATAYIKSHGTKANVGSKIPGGGTLRDHILHYAIDLDGDGIIRGASVGGEAIDVRATAIVWCCGRDGKIEAYSTGMRKDDVHSWSVGQTVDVR